MRSTNGCWTCRLRRKKCDEAHPICDNCAALQIPCHFEEDKPEWMDGGTRQEAMAAQLKRDIKTRIRYRGGQPSVISTSRPSASPVASPSYTGYSPETSRHSLHQETTQVWQTAAHESTETSSPAPVAIRSRNTETPGCSATPPGFSARLTMSQSDTLLFMFYLEHIMPFLFPFFLPSPSQGGRAWILDMMIHSPVVRQATLCQSSYFYSLTTSRRMRWEAVLEQTGDALRVLKEALEVIDQSDISDHLPGAVRVLTAIMQLQRFEIAISSFENCQAHLRAALALFKQVLYSSQSSDSRSNFRAVLTRLGPPLQILPDQSVEVLSAEQAAFLFSTALLILDDTIASTVLQEEPNLHPLHRMLLAPEDGTQPVVNLEEIVGCPNSLVIQIAEIAKLDKWKQQCKQVGNLNVMELVYSASTIKQSLEDHLEHLDAEIDPQPGNRDLPSAFTADKSQQTAMEVSQRQVVSRIWAHAALIYLHTVVSGWQPASSDVRRSVTSIVELITVRMSPPTLLRAIVWPFCIAGCLAEPEQECEFRAMVEHLHPPSVFGTVHKALEIMEEVWRCRNEASAATRDLAACFQGRDGLVLLV